MAAPSLRPVDTGPLPGPVDACSGEELSPQLPVCSLPPASVGIVLMDHASPLWPLDVPPISKTAEGLV